MRYLFLILLLFVWFKTSFAQTEVVEQVRQIKLYYRSSVAYGFYIHTAGWGGSFKYQRHASFKDKRLYMIEFQNLKHPKEEKVFNAFDDNAKGFYYGKMNSFSNLRFGYGVQHAVAAKEIKKGVQVAYLYSGGVNLGLLKPIYLQVYDIDGGNQIITERYDPPNHPVGIIYGRANFYHGLNELELIPGLFGKFGLNFEFSPYDNTLKSIEVGVALDVFYKEVPMMYSTYNNQYWVSFYLMFEFGKKIE